MDPVEITEIYYTEVLFLRLIKTTLNSEGRINIELSFIGDRIMESGLEDHFDYDKFINRQCIVTYRFVNEEAPWLGRVVSDLKLWKENEDEKER